MLYVLLCLICYFIFLWVLNGELYAQRLQSLIYLHLSTDCYRCSWQAKRNLHKHKPHATVYVYSLISHPVHQTSQFKPLVFELFLIWSHLLWGEFSAFSTANAIHYSQFFVPPGTHHCWVDRDGMRWEACSTSLHMAGSMTLAPVIHPSTNRVRHCLTSVIWRELVTTRPCATMHETVCRQMQIN